MADKKRSVLPWGMTKDGLQPNSVKVLSPFGNQNLDDRVFISQAITQAKLKAFQLGSMNPQLNKEAPFVKKKEQREEKKRVGYVNLLRSR